MEKTTIKNNERVFILCGDMNRQIVCNIRNIGYALKQFDDIDSVKIFHIFNCQMKRATKKMLNNMIDSYNLCHPTKQINIKF